MKLTNILHKFKTLFPTKQPNIASRYQLAMEFGIACLLAAVAWLAGPRIGFAHHLFASPEKRIYLIIGIFLLWLLKLLLTDLVSALHLKEPITRQKLKALRSRFQGVVQFLKQTTVTRHGEPVRLNQLPWYLIIGPKGSGKTTLLANANVHYVLQRQLQPQEKQIAASEQCDWWVTRDVSLIDVPGKYLAIPTLSKTSEEKPAMLLALFRGFLRMIKKYRGKHPLDGILIALPLPEIMKQGDAKKYHVQLRHLFLRIAEIQAMLDKPIPCYLLVTKCDQLAGFNEFFAEASDEEITQSWGITVPKPKPNEKVSDLCAQRFDMLVKKLNQQLLYRLHQERNPMARPYIKDFPLQVERLKEFTLDFVKKFAGEKFALELQGIYFTSALQTVEDTSGHVIDASESTERALQLFKAPVSASRAYFIKQFLLQGLTQTKPEQTKKYLSAWKRRVAFAMSLSVIVIAAVIFGKDFEIAVKQAYTVQNTLSDYRLAIQKTTDANEQLTQTLNLLNHLEKTADNETLPLNVNHALNFYSSKARQKSVAVYQHALQNILIPELQSYLGDYLKNPVNKNGEQIYGALKAYLMLNDFSHYQADFIENTVQLILPSSFGHDYAAALQKHLSLALSNNKKPLALDQALVNNTRRYLTALPNFQLSFVILKNINNNTSNAIDFETQTNMTAAFNNRELWKKIPTMFTAKAFNTIISQDAMTASNEALFGNWVLGNTVQAGSNPANTDMLLQQLRATYVTNYINTWENMLGNIRLSKSENLAQTDALIVNLISSHSPLLSLLQTLHDNTYFEPISSSSQKLQNIGLLLDKSNDTNNQLYQIFTGLQTLHQYLNNVLTAENERKAAFEVVSARMQHSGETDIITQLRLVADKSPEPVKSWLNKITSDAWRFLMQDSTRYIDVSWQEQVSRPYETDIANHYPFSQNATQEVGLNKFTTFFGNPGTFVSFYKNYLVAFIDTSSAEWRWKTIDNIKPAFPDDTLRQVQAAYNIHHMFFPNGDDKLHVQFALQPYELSKKIKSVRLRINAKNMIDKQAGEHASHVLSWPNNVDTKMTSVHFTLNNQKKLNRDYPGDWGLFKLINQSTVGTITNKELLINFSEHDYPAKYLLFTQGQRNPFTAMNMQNLQLPKLLSDRPRTIA